MSLSDAASKRYLLVTFDATVTGAGGIAATPTAPLITECTELANIAAGNSHGVVSATELPTQFITIQASMSSSTGMATIMFICADGDIQDNSGNSSHANGDGKLWYATATIAAQTLRQSHNTGGGNYVATVQLTANGLAAPYPGNILDVHPGTGNKNGWPKWYVCCTALSGGTLSVYIAPGRAL